MKRLTSSILAAALGTAAGCGSDDANEPSTGSAGSAGTNNAAGASSAGSAQGGGGGTSGGGQPGASGEAGAGGEGPADCLSLGSSANIAGTLEGSPIAEYWDVSSVAHVMGDPWMVSYEFEDEGFDFFRGTNMGDPLNFGEGARDLEVGVLWAPATSSLEGAVVCFGAGSAEAVNPPQLELRTDTAKLLGSCPGEPVDGELVLCSDGSLNCPEPVADELDGAMLDRSGVQVWGSGVGTPSMSARGEHLMAKAFADRAIESEVSGNIEQAILITFPSSALGGAVYCAGEGSTFDWSTAENGTRMTFRNLSKLGDCDGEAGSDSLLLCR